MGPKIISNSPQTECGEHAENIVFSRLVKCEPGDEIAITGISGIYPKAENIRELGEKLFANEDLVSDIPCQLEDDGPSRAPRYGKINEERIKKFDANFFKISTYGSDAIDPQSRMLMELAYEAILDAGYNPEHFRGTKTGVFVALYRSDSSESWIYEKNAAEGATFYGNSRSMIASRISFFLGLTGPVSSVDSSCSSSFTALDSAFKNIRTGVCDAAIVTGSNLCLNWQTIKRWHTMGMLSAEGKCQMFSETANGYCRSEALVAILIQKKKDARRLYTELVHIKLNNSGDKAGSIEKTSDISQIELLDEFYAECKIDPTSMNYVELHGTGTKLGDVMEANAVEKCFCSPGRTTPVKVGSIKTNMGHSEAASGLCAISKAILMFELERIPANLHFYEPRSDIKALASGRIQVITEPEPFHDDLIPIMNLGYGGSNCHALFRRNRKSKINAQPMDDCPRLVVASGRTEKSVQNIFDSLLNKPIDSEFVGLLHEIFADEIPNHIYRGYLSVNAKGEQCAKQIENFSGEKRPIWFIFRGMGSQYPTMGEALLQIPVTRESIYKSHEVLKKKGLNLIEIISKDDPKIFDNILYSFVAISAIQIALVDLLSAVAIHPDGMIGHSFGELGCAYADGCLTAEQTILSSYKRGMVSNETALIPGYMAAVGLSYDELKSLLPKDIDVACHNAFENYSISGPKKSMRTFTDSLQKTGVFVRKFNVSNIAYHSRYIRPLAPQHLLDMKIDIPEPKLRSSKWICSSVPEAEWSTMEAKYSCAEYYVNNLQNCVYFDEACQHIPNNAITIEISPHGFLQALLKRKSNLQITNVPLLSRNFSNGADFLLNALGRLYTLGLNPKVQALYPPVIFPVSRGTPMIAPLIEWNHESDYFVTKHFSETKKSAEQTFTVSLLDPEWECVRGHKVDGRTLFPGVGYLYAVWKIFSKINGIDCWQNSVVIENVKFKRATVLSKQGQVEFTINIQKGCGSFEVTENDTVVASGSIRKLVKTELTSNDFETIETDLANETELPLKTADIYKDYRLRGYQYDGQFVGIVGAAFDGSVARVKWENNFVTFLDSIIQVQLLSINTKQLLVPTGIERITINTQVHREFLKRLSSEQRVPEFIVHHDKSLSMCKTAGVEIKRVSLNNLQRKPLGEEVTLQKIQFLPFQACNMDLNHALVVCCEIVKQNLDSFAIKTLELVEGSESDSTLFSLRIYEILSYVPQIKIKMEVMFAELYNNTEAEKLLNKYKIHVRETKLSLNERFTLIIASNFTRQKEFQQFCMNTLAEDGFLLLRESNPEIIDQSIGLPNQLDVCLKYELADENILLCRRKKTIEENIMVIQISNNSYDWIENIRSALKNISGYNGRRLILYAEKEEFSGIVGLSNCLFKEYGTENLRCYFIADDTAPKFSVHDPFYREQISKDLLINIYKQQSWGGFCDFLLDSKSKIQLQHVVTQLEIPGDISSLSLVEGPLDPFNYHSLTENVLLYVYYSELNFRDVLLASAKLSLAVLNTDDCIETTLLGFGCSGKTVDGKRYMAVAKSGCFATLIEQDPYLLLPVPNNWSLEEAATVPIAYLTVFYSFFFVERLRRGDSVLVHSGSGGVGQAAIHICLYYGCTVFTTVGSQEKRDFIKKTFPSIPDSHIGNSRDCSFENMIMRETDGRGVDAVLNSLSEEKLLASVKCLAAGGRFIEIGLYDFAVNNPLHMGCFLKEISFHAIQLNNFFETTVVEKKRMIDLMIEHLENGAIKPLNRTVFDLEDAEVAFRYMKSGKHIGKVLLKTRMEESGLHTVPEPLSKLAIPKYSCSEKKSYVCVGGLGGLGLELIDWLVLRGARNVIISSRRGITTGYQSWKIKKWQSRGARVIVLTDDVTKEEGVLNLLQTANSLAPVSAIFNLALVLHDALFENQTAESFAACAGPKANATVHLDHLSRKMCVHLEHFVVFSSVSCGFGNMGQTNYGMANSIMERICERRKADNLPGIAIQWGPMADVGVIVEKNIEKTITTGGMTEQPVHSFLKEMDFLLRQQSAVVRSIILNKIESTKVNEKVAIEFIGKILGLKDMGKMDPKAKLTDYGMDSITTIEVKQIFEREFDIVASIKDIKEMTIGRITELQNSSKKSYNTSSTVSSKQVSHTYIKLMGHGFKLLANQNQSLNTQGEEWRIVKLPLSRDNGRCPSKTVFVFPGFEGHTEYMKSILNCIPAPMYRVQYSSDVSQDDLYKICEKLAALIVSTLVPNEDFTFIAYSYGCAVAIETLKIIENQNRTGRLFLIDVDPIIASSAVSKLGNADQLMHETIVQFLSVFWPASPKMFLDEIRALKDWNSKIELVVSHVCSNTSKFTQKQLRHFLNLVYQRAISIKNWQLNTEQPLVSQTTLIRPTVNLFEDNVCYDLTKHFSSPVDVENVEGNHFTMLKNIKIQKL